MTGAAIADERPFRLGHHTGLDGLRGLAILLVVPYNLGWPVSGGYIGVDLFFVLSGFLITTLLLEERRTAGRVDFRAFYMRRALRLLPALIVLLLALSAAATLLHPPELARDYYFGSLVALFYIANWYLGFGGGEAGEVMGPLIPTWSLSVEEQFYLIWPPILVLVLARGTKLGRLLLWMAAAITASELLRIGLSLADAHPWRIYMGTDTRAGVLLIGCSAAVVAHHRGTEALGKVAAPAGWIALILLLIAGLTLPDGATPWVERFGFFTVACLTVTLLVHLVAYPKGGLARLFSVTPLVVIGRVSYGLYLWHYPIAIFVTTERLGLSRPWVEALRVVLLAAVVTISWFVVERPALRLKKRWKRVGGDGRAPPIDGPPPPVDPLPRQTP